MSVCASVLLNVDLIRPVTRLDIVHTVSVKRFFFSTSINNCLPLLLPPPKVLRKSPSHVRTLISIIFSTAAAIDANPIRCVYTRVLVSATLVPCSVHAWFESKKLLLLLLKWRGGKVVVTHRDLLAALLLLKTVNALFWWKCARPYTILTIKHILHLINE